MKPFNPGWGTCECLETYIGPERWGWFCHRRGYEEYSRLRIKAMQRQLLLQLLSRFSRVQLCVTPQTAAHQALLSLGFSRQEHWSGLPFPSPVHVSEKWKWSCSVMSSWLFTTPWTAAYQSPLPMGFSRQEYWSGVPLPSPCKGTEGCKAQSVQGAVRGLEHRVWGRAKWVTKLIK